MGVVPTLCDRELNMYVIKTLQSKTGGGGEKGRDFTSLCKGTEKCEATQLFSARLLCCLVRISLTKLLLLFWILQYSW